MHCYVALSNVRYANTFKGISIDSVNPSIKVYLCLVFINIVYYK